jgi:RHS repeat-associated protein
MVVKMVMDNGTVFSKTSTGSSLKLYPYSRGINAFPISATFSVYDSGGALLYTSQHFSEINSGDTFAYSASSFYPNAIKYGMHSKCVGTFAYQDDLGKVPTATYLRYDVEGNQVETRSLLGASWTYTQAAFDIYGNMISSTDATGRTTCTEYSSASKYTYPTSSWVEGKRENLDWDTSWSLTRSVPAGDTSWLQSTYTTARSYSPSRSIKESLSGASQNGLDYGTVTYYKDLYANEVSKISVRMYVESYSHNNNASDAMDSGIRLRLYDAAGANYANYTYWLACWSGSQDNRTSADPYVSVVCGKPTLNTWLLRDLYPMSKWNVDTSRCDKIRIEAYTNCLNAYGDQFIVYYDDITYADSAEEVGDSFDSGLGWGTSLSSSNGVTSWLSGGYSAAQSVSSPNSMRAGFSNGPVGYDTGTTTNYRAYEADIVTKVSLRMYVQSYSHDGSAWDTMDAGLKMRLYNAAGTNYATYTYWLACWYQAANNKTAPDQTVKVIYGRPATGQWLNLNLEPNKDFSISWNGCVKVRFELYSYGSGTSGDTFLAYFDDFNIKGQDAPRTSYTWDTKNGRQLSVTDPLGHVTSQWYDALGRVIRSNVTVDNDKFTANIYDDEANKMTITNELGQKVVTYYDTVGRAVKVQRTGYGSTAYSTVTTSYTWQDKPARTYDAAGRVTKYSYDYLGRVTLVLNNDGTSSSVSYDDRNMKVTATDENGHKTVSVKDKLGRLNATREYSTATAFNSTIVSYDAAGNVKAVRAANNEVTRMSYDSLGRQTSITYPDGYAESTTYDAAGNVFNATARDGAVTRTYYDATGRAIRVASASETISSVYDAEGNLVRTSSALGFITYQYDNQHRVVGEVERINSTSYGIGFTYNADGSISSALYPDGRTISYLYDQYGRNVDIKYGTNRLLNITYNKDDTVATKNYYNSSIATTYTYNSRGFVASIVSKNSQQANQMALTYTYDSEGNVRTIVDGMRSVTETYYYDHADRLIYAAGNWNGTLTLTYTYDVMGNRLTKNEGSAITYSYNSYNQLHTEGVWHYDHDRSGNVIWKNSTGERWKFVYNSFGQMTQVLKQTYSGGVWSPLTTVARTVENGVSTSYVYAGHDPMLQISADGKSNKYLYCNGRLEVRQIDGTEGYVYIADALGSTRRVFRNGDTTQTTFAALSYMPFGKALMSVSSDRVRFADEIQDSTNLVYLFARYYDPELGRFYALDPVHGKLSMPQTLDRYVYCGDNPLSRTDPTGRFWGLQILVGAVVGAALGAVVAIASGGDINEIAKGAVAGAIGGAVFGATMGLCTMAVAPGVIASAAPLIAGGVSSGTESFVGEFLKTGDVGQSIKAAAVGTAVGVLSAGSSHLLFKGGIGKKISDAVGDRVTSIAERRTERIIDSSAIAEKQTVVSQMLPSHARMIGQGGRDFVETLPLSVQSSYAVNKGVEWLSPQES